MSLGLAMVLELGFDCCDVVEGLRVGELEANESSIEFFKSLCDAGNRGLNFNRVLIAFSAASSTSEGGFTKTKNSSGYGKLDRIEPTEAVKKLASRNYSSE